MRTDIFYITLFILPRKKKQYLKPLLSFFYEADSQRSNGDLDAEPIKTYINSKYSNVFRILSGNPTVT